MATRRGNVTSEDEMRFKRRIEAKLETDEIQVVASAVKDLMKMSVCCGENDHGCLWSARPNRNPSTRQRLFEVIEGREASKQVYHLVLWQGHTSEIISDTLQVS
ncbi:unnamed protein product [Aphanomyces euteiches]